jgi:putative transposase
MPVGLKRYQESKQIHFVTFSCYRRLPRLPNNRVRDMFVECLERTRRRYRFRVYGYVVMPEHVHLLVSETEVALLTKAIQALKISVARREMRYHEKGDSTLWQKRYYDHNVRSYESFVEKLRYIHRNPVKRGLVEKPEDWKWSSFRHYVTDEGGPVEIESQWTADRRNGRTPDLMQLTDD